MGNQRLFGRKVVFMFRRILVFMPLMVLAVLSSCFWGEKEQPVPAANRPGLKVVNVLAKNLYDDAHIHGSIQVDFNKVKQVAQAWDKNDPVVFYCSNYQCQASFEAARQLTELGFSNAMAFEGGMEEWYRLNQEGDGSFKIQGPATQDYLKIKVAKPQHHAQQVKIVPAEELKAMMQKWRFTEQSSWARGKQIRIEEREPAIEGITEGLDEQGFLQVRTPQGLQRVLSGTVSAM